MDNEILKNELVYSVWTILEIVMFAEFHITEVNNGSMYFEMVEREFCRNRQIPELLELHRLVKIPFKLKYFRKEFKAVENKGKKEKEDFLIDLRYEMQKFMSNVVRMRLNDLRVSDLVPIESLKFTVKNQEVMFK